MKTARCPTCHRRHKRSNPQNSRLWLLYHAIAEKLRPNGQEFGAEVWHEYFKSKYIGKTDIRLPNGKTKIIEASTAELDVAEFNAYMEAIEAWAAERGVWLADLESAA